MPKVAKKLASKPSLIITDFFSPKSSSSGKEHAKRTSPAAASSGLNDQMSNNPRTRPSRRTDEPDISGSSSRSARASQLITCPDITSPTGVKPRRSARLSQPPPTPAASSSSTPRHAPSACAPIVENTETPARVSVSSSKSNQVSKRKNKFDIDPDVDILDTVVCVKRNVDAIALHQPVHSLVKESHNAPKKRPRILSPECPPPSDVIPSSQSGELELATPTELAQDFENQQRHEYPHFSSPLTNSSSSGLVDMIVGTEDDPIVVRPVSSPSPSLTTEVGIKISDDTSSASSSPRQKPSTPSFFSTPGTPSSSSSFALPTLPESPVVLDPASKTAKIIADIKARAIAYAKSSPEPDLPDFKDTLDSDEEDPEPLSVAFKLDKVPLEADQPMPTSSRYYNLRRRHEPAATVDPPSTSLEVEAHDVYPAVVIKNSNGKGKAVHKRILPATRNPLDVLLKEKRLADKKGNGTEALHQAELTLAGKFALFSEMDDENLDDWEDDPFSSNAIHNHGLGDGASGSLTCEPSGRPPALLDAHDQQRLFGEQCGKAIAGILRSDREGLAEETAQAKVRGMPLWKSGHDDEDLQMEDEMVFPFVTAEDDPLVVGFFIEAIRGRNFQTAELLIRAGLGTNTDRIVPCLCHLSLLFPAHKLSESAFIALQRVWNPSVQRSAAGLPFNLVVCTLIKLGAMRELIASMAWTTNPKVRSCNPDIATRDKILFRLVRMMELSARYSSNVPEDVPDMIIALLLLALDPSCTDTREQHVKLAIHYLCESLGESDCIVADLESVLCTKVLGLISDFTPINKAHIISVISAGSGRTTRIARWIAHCIINGDHTVSARDYCSLPPLLRITGQLLPRTTDELPQPPNELIFQIQDDTDYVDMGFYVEILGTALSDIGAYAEREARMGKTQLDVGSVMSSPGRVTAEKLDTPLQLLRNAIEVIHSRIADTRAAHLDRSRTKAALKQLSMRIYYQRQAAIKSVKGTGKIQHYFARKTLKP